MTLSNLERNTIARRAAGEYGAVPAVRRIVEAHRRNQTPEDQVFLDFARLIIKQTWDWGEYQRLQKAVLTLIPNPFGPPVVHRKAPGRKSGESKPPGKPLPAAGLLDLLSSGPD